MNLQSQTKAFVDLKNSPGLYRVESTSSTVYYVDARDGGMLLMRARGTGATAQGPHDNRWVTLTSIVSGPRIEDGNKDVPEEEVDLDDFKAWVLRVGSRHQYDFRTPGGPLDITDWWWTQRPATRIEKLAEMPSDDDLTVEESDDPRYRRDSAPDYRGMM